MPKTYNIKWRESDIKELERIINNFNAKLYRIKKKNPDAEQWLPQRLKKKEVMESITTRKDYNRVTASYKRFSKRGAEAPVKSSRGAKASSWALKEFEKQKRIENKKREKLEKEIGSKDVTQAGKSVGVKRAEMGGIKENAVKPYTHKFDNMSQKEWEKASALMEKRMFSSHDKIMRERWLQNYIKGLIRVGAPQDVIDMMKHIDPDDFAQIIDLDEYGTIDWIYDPQELEVRMEKIRETWKDYVKDNTYVTEDQVSRLSEQVKYEHELFGYEGRHNSSDGYKWWESYYQVHKARKG